MVFATTIMAILWLALPGLLLSLRERRAIEYHAAAATVSIVSMALVAALLSVILSLATGDALPPWLPLASTLPFVVINALGMRKTGIATPDFEWQSLAPAGVVVLLSAYTYSVGFAPQPDESLHVHSWYNADWFKHLGHANAVANLGLPARDIFGGGGPLHYYWLFYAIPGAASGLNGDPAGSLYWVNLATAALFWLLLYGLVRRTGASAWQTAVLVTLAITLFSVGATINWLRSGLSLVEFPQKFEPAGPVLISMGLYIPQHTLMISILLAWLLIAVTKNATPPRPLHWLTLASLAAAGAVSTLFGALCLLVYGLAQLASCNRSNWRPIFAELSCVGMAAIAIVFALNILDPGMGRNAISSPLFDNQGTSLTYPVRFLVTTTSALSTLGPAMLLGIAMLSRWQKASNKPADRLLVIAWILLAIGIAGTVLPEALMDNLRLARELRIRSPYLAATGSLIGLGWALAQSNAGKLNPGRVYGLLGACFALAAPGGFMWVAWHGTKGPEFFTEIPADDMRAMRHLSHYADRKAMVWQYPEPPELAAGRGDDVWVPILAGRMVPASLRATDFPKTASGLSAMESFFVGSGAPVPPSVDWIYLSRKLHPASFDSLKQLLSNDRQWKPAYCSTRACLFQRVKTAGAK